MNTSAKGNKYEWAVQRKLEAKGWTVQRSAASHGPFDLIAWKGRRLAFFQAKDDGRECTSADNTLLKLPHVPYGDVVLVHECRATCGRVNYLPNEFCLHVRFPGVSRPLAEEIQGV